MVDTDTSKPRWLAVPRAEHNFSAPLTAVTFSADGATAVVCAADEFITVCSSTGHVLSRTKGVPAVHKLRLQGHDLLANSDGDVVSHWRRGRDGTFKRIADYKTQWAVCDMRFAPRGTAVVADYASIYVLNLRTPGEFKSQLLASSPTSQRVFGYGSGRRSYSLMSLVNLQALSLAICNPDCVNDPKLYIAAEAAIHGRQLLAGRKQYWYFDARHLGILRCAGSRLTGPGPLWVPGTIMQAATAPDARYLLLHMHIPGAQDDTLAARVARYLAPADPSVQISADEAYSFAESLAQAMSRLPDLGAQLRRLRDRDRVMHALVMRVLCAVQRDARKGFCPQSATAIALQDGSRCFTVHICSEADGARVGEIPVDAPITQMALSPDGASACFLFAHGRMQLWDVLPGIRPFLSTTRRIVGM